MTHFEIAAEVAKDYTALTGTDPERIALLRQAIIQGIHAKLVTVSFDQRELDEFGLALFYVRRSHGTEGHNRLKLLAKFAELMGMRLEGETKLRGITVDGG